jgi:hypothetical protein
MLTAGITADTVKAVIITALSMNSFNPQPNADDRDPALPLCHNTHSNHGDYFHVDKPAPAPAIVEVSIIDVHRTMFACGINCDISLDC